MIDTGKLVVSSKVLGHISEGLYRGPSGVFKELLSNAFDANARTVWISTGRPTFDVVSVRDDGDGMILKKFKEVVTGGIGDSDKRARNSPLINGRQTIGRLGIGILGVSQISHEFSIVSHSRSKGTAFRANVQMMDFRKEILDQAGDIAPGEDNGQNQGKGFAVGGYEAEEIGFEPEEAGLTITATDPTEGFRRQLSEDNPDPLPKEFRVFGQNSRVKDQLATGPWYNRMVWQVASLAPISYMSDSVISEGDETMTTIANALDEFDFKVIVDGVSLFKPVLVDLPATVVPTESKGQGEGPFHFQLEYDKVVWGAQLRVRGYIYGSAGTALHPDDIRGVLIRLKDVGIGEYDKSFLGYRYAEGPRFAWLTGELYVEEGLEDALTVGRDGFDIGHPHYIALRKWLHEQLRDRVFPTLYRGIKSRRLKKETVRTQERTEAFFESISGFAGKPIRVVDVDERGGPPVSVDLDHGIAALNTTATWPRGKRQREMAERLGIIFELVRMRGSNEESIDEFVDLTRDLLSRQ